MLQYTSELFSFLTSTATLLLFRPCVIRSGTREVHNKLEKNRRAHLKECFELLKKQLPAQEEKKSSNLSILHAAIRHIQVQNFIFFFILWRRTHYNKPKVEYLFFISILCGFVSVYVNVIRMKSKAARVDRRGIQRDSEIR